MKKKNFGRNFLIFSLITGVSLISGCGQSYKGASTEELYVNTEALPAAYEEMDYEEYSENCKSEASDSNSMVDFLDEETNTSVNTNRKLIKNVDMDVETKEYDILLVNLRTKIDELGGYIEEMNTYNGNSYYGYRDNRYASLVIRIPQTSLGDFISDVENTANVLNRNETVTDVTLEYVDVESKKEALLVEKDRLLELMEQAETVEDLLAIEARMTEIRYELESAESRLRSINNQVDYSTVRLNISEVTELTPVEEQSVSERIVEGFKETLDEIGTGSVDFVIWFVVNLPYLLIWAIIILVIIVVYKKVRKKMKKTKQTKEQDQEGEK